GDEIESIRAYSPFTQRALHPVERAVVYPAAERRLDLDKATLPDEDGPPPVPRDLVPPLEGPPDLVWEPEAVRRVWEEEGLKPVSMKGVAELDPLPSGQPFLVRAATPGPPGPRIAEAGKGSAR